MALVGISRMNFDDWIAGGLCVIGAALYFIYQAWDGLRGQLPRPELQKAPRPD